MGAPRARGSPSWLPRGESTSCSEAFVTSIATALICAWDTDQQSATFVPKKLDFSALRPLVDGEMSNRTVIFALLHPGTINITRAQTGSDSYGDIYGDWSSPKSHNDLVSRSGPDGPSCPVRLETTKEIHLRSERGGGQRWNKTAKVWIPNDILELEFHGQEVHRSALYVVGKLLGISAGIASLPLRGRGQWLSQQPFDPELAVRF